ncbi:DarT ssDNA thymidine ADP-ribosyltransferase family protein [Stenotrophomonas rhizophila]|uniref:DarT ssDNA thymidine ADP-ribosyltransferase family protein n=1 Tax=Stenotrophomonas rhizophila TaxID=216778 RepID=UPI002A6A1BE8|nr:DarT ssDNA thymidine ADP-ribosyltransferase family protein [Stenotrophomonas rhizophila]MDY0953154.1 DarT ssDNA thymidine ADP-ribosyltransferase family protein [Stenotrophomonas rhizophila]
MKIPDCHVGRHVYHFSHIDNLPGILKYGFLATNNPNFPSGHRSIAAASIQERRAQMAVTCGPGGNVHDYVPLYFGSCSPMLLRVLHTKNVDQCEILYFEFPISLVLRKDAIFTDAAANADKPPAFYSDPGELEKLDWTAIDSLKWGNPGGVEYKRRRMAELLIHRIVPISAASRCVVWNKSMKLRVEQIVGDSPFVPIDFESAERRHYYTNLELKDNSTLVKGPKQIAGEYREACQYVQEFISSDEVAANPGFANIKELLKGLRNDFGCLPHTQELVGLKSENGIHKHSVDKHTKDVARVLLELPEYELLPDRSKVIVEIAAYLHDIGKGPRARWASNGGVQKIDPNHPVGAMPMVAEIMTEHVESVRLEDAKSILKLVCYHDLVGDVLGRDRDERQIVDVVDNRGELDMLFAIGKADATSLVEKWWNQSEASALYVRSLAQI